MEQQQGEIATCSPIGDAPLNDKLANGEPINKIPATDRPNRWVAAVLSFLLPPLGMLNVAQPTWAAVYFFAGVMMSRHFEGDEYLPVAVAIFMTLGIRVVAATHAYRLALRYPSGKPRPFYSRGPVAVALYLGLAFLLLGLPVVLGMVAQASCVGATCK